MEIVTLPLLQDNYAYLLVAADGRRCVVVDPGEGPPVVAALRQRGLLLEAILATHHHHDHTGGVAYLLGHSAANVEVLASSVDAQRIAGVTRLLEHRAGCRVLDEDMLPLAVPGHTLGAMAFYFPAAAALFTGDTLFLAGCGRLLEGSAAQLFASLQSLAQLPAATRVYCGHEYTEKNLRFALQVEPQRASLRARLQHVQQLRQAGLPSVPATLAEELQSNPFLRCTTPTLQAWLGVTTPLAAFTRLRQQRDTFV